MLECVMENDDYFTSKREEVMFFVFHRFRLLKFLLFPEVRNDEHVTPATDRTYFIIHSYLGNPNFLTMREMNVAIKAKMISLL